MTQHTTPRASGRCLCGAVSFQVVGDLRDVFNCHCHRCRRFTGHHMAATAANVTDLMIKDEGSALRWFYPAPEAGYLRGAVLIAGWPNPATHGVSE